MAKIYINGGDGTVLVKEEVKMVPQDQFDITVDNFNRTIDQLIEERHKEVKKWRLVALVTTLLGVVGTIAGLVT